MLSINQLFFKSSQTHFHLAIENKFNQRFILPSNIERLTLDTKNPNIWDNIPNGTEYLRLDFVKKRFLSNIPNSVTTIVVDKN